MNETLVVALTFVVYLIAMAIIGWVAYAKTKNSNDFFLGARSLGPWVTALSAGASDMSGWLLFALPGMAYSLGISALWNAAGLLCGTYLNWLFVAARLRVFSEVADEAVTIPGFFSARFQDHSGTIRILCAIFILLFFFIYTGSGLVAGGKLFSATFGIDYQTAVILGAAAIVSYTLFGGFIAVSWTDLVQGLLMSAALMIVPVTAIFYTGGFGASLEAISALDPSLLQLTRISVTDDANIVAMVSLCAWGLGYFGQPHILVRFKAIRNAAELPQARRIAMTWTGFCIIGAICSGMSGIGFFATPLADPEKVYLALVHAIFHPVVAGILLAAILAAVMSTADSQLLVASSCLAEDLGKGWLFPNISDRALMNLSRLSVIGVTTASVALAWDPSNKVLDLAAFAWAGFGAAFGAAMLLSLYWRRMTRRGALAGILVGATTVVIWHFAHGGIFDVYEILPGFIFAVIAIVLASLSQEPSDSMLDLYDRFESRLRQEAY